MCDNASMKLIMIWFGSFNVLLTEIDNIFIGKRNADYVWQSVPIHI